MEKLITISKAAQQLGLTKRTLQLWDKSGQLPALRTKGGHRRYRQSDISNFQGIMSPQESEDKVVVYCRVSSQDQKKKGDLGRQKLRVLEYCATQGYTIGFMLDEVGSGMNSNRPKLKQLFQLVTEKKVNKVIIEYKDRLTRFQFQIFVEFFLSHGVVIEFIAKTLPKTFEAELVEDMLALLSSFSAKIYGKRSAERRKKKKELVS